jgi:pimeloyl-ACP methyl ester carboxylesterase
VPFRGVTEADAQAGQAALWQLHDAVRARTLLLRGADSDLLSRATAQEMARRGPRPRIVEFEGVGHAPTLVADPQVEAVAAFLLQTESAPDEKPYSGTG